MFSSIFFVLVFNFVGVQTLLPLIFATNECQKNSKQYFRFYRYHIVNDLTVEWHRWL